MELLAVQISDEMCIRDRCRRRFWTSCSTGIAGMPTPPSTARARASRASGRCAARAFTRRADPSTRPIPSIRNNRKKEIVSLLTFVPYEGIQ